MDLEEFKEYLKQNNIKYTENGKGLSISGTLNDDNVYIKTITSIPDNITFNNRGDVTLHKVATLPENTIFNNYGNVILMSMDGEIIKYRGEELRLKNRRRFTYIVDLEKTKGGLTFNRGRLFGGGDLDRLKKIYVVSMGDKYFTNIDESNMSELTWLANLDLFGDFRVFNFIKEEDFQ